MPDTIWVSPHPSLAADNKVALYEQHPDHPTEDGWIMIDGADEGPHEVAETPGVLFALSQPYAGATPQLVRADGPSAKAATAKAATDTKPAATTGGR